MVAAGHAPGIAIEPAMGCGSLILPPAGVMVNSPTDAARAGWDWDMARTTRPRASKAQAATIAAALRNGCGTVTAMPPGTVDGLR